MELGECFIENPPASGQTRCYRYTAMYHGNSVRAATQRRSAVREREKLSVVHLLIRGAMTALARGAVDRWLARHNGARQLAACPGRKGQ